jgi:hypothetical protein
MAAELEEALFRADPVARQTDHLGEDLRDRLFHGATRRDDLRRL